MKNTTQQTDEAGAARLHRAVDGRMVGGVAAGLATYFAVEVTYVRIAFAVLSVLGGAGLPMYLAAWALIPERRFRCGHSRGVLPPRWRCYLVNAVREAVNPSRSFEVKSSCCEKGTS